MKIELIIANERTSSIARLSFIIIQRWAQSIYDQQRMTIH